MKKEAEKKETMENPLYNESNGSNIYDIPGILHPEYPKELRNLFMKYKQVFHSKINRETVMNTPPVKFTIDKEAPKPRKCTRPYKIPAAWQETGYEMIKRMEEQGIIKRLQGHSDYLAPMKFVAKPSNPDSPCMVIDYRGLNKTIIRTPQPLATVTDELLKLKTSS